MKEKNMTGYPSIDKPWLKYYDTKFQNEEVPQMNISDYLKTNTVRYNNTNAIDYFGKKINYSTLLKKIEEVSLAYTAQGVKQDDVVAFCVPTLPEIIYSLYAVNDIGAISCFIDPRTGAERIKKCLNVSNSKILVTIDLALPKIDHIIDSTKIEKVISLKASESLPFIKKFLYNIKDKSQDYNGKGYINWEQFIKNINQTYSYKNTYNDSRPATIVYTSGTTSDPKGVLISDKSLNSIAYQYGISGVPHEKGDRFLNVMPAFLLYGLACGIHMPLSLGMTNIVIPQVNMDKFANLVLKHEPRHFMISPIIFEKMTKSKIMKGKDLSFITSAGIGGSGITDKQEDDNNQFLQEHNCSNKLAKGYGATEGGSALVATLFNACDAKGSAGIPLPLNTVSIFKYTIDDDGNIMRTDEELSYNEEGEICVTGPTLMMGYLNNEELTNQVLVKHKDGKVWLHTSDRGYINENGNVFIYDRIGRMIITPDSHNIYLGSIEDVIKNHPAINECAVVGISVEGYEKGKLPKAVISIKEEYKTSYQQIVQELITKCNNQLPERDVARYYEIVDEIPKNLGGKPDYQLLSTKIIGNFIDANIQISDLVKQKVLKKQFK